MNPLVQSILLSDQTTGADSSAVTIDQSLRFRGTQALHHTFSRASTGNTATLSFWVKIAELDREHCFIINRNGSHRIVNVRNLNDWCFNPAGSSFTAYDSATLARDPSAWYHVLVIQDAGTTTLFVNGDQVGNSTTSASDFWDSTGDNQLVIGAETDSGGGSTSVCYLAEYNLLDGTAIGVTNGVPDEFGEYNDDDVWVPKDISSLTAAQYGADGFRLTFDSSQTNATHPIGEDSAPIGATGHTARNDFTEVNFDTTTVVTFAGFTTTNTAFSASQPALLGFNGSDSSGESDAAGESSVNTTITFAPVPAIDISGKTVVLNTTNTDSTISLGGADTATSSGNNTVDKGTATEISTTTPLVLTRNTQSSSTGFRSISVDGTILTENTSNDVDFNDTPTNNFATLNPLLARSRSLNYEEGNLRAQYGSGGAFAGMIGYSIPPNSGKWYWEVTLKEEKEGDVGIVSEDFDLEDDALAYGTTFNGWSWDYNEGRRDHKDINAPNSPANEIASSHRPILVGDTIGFKLDTTAGTCSIEINGIDQVAGAVVGNVTLTNGSEFTNIPTDKIIYPFFRLGGASGDANLDWNFGQMPFLHEPTGYQSLATNSLSEPAIKHGKDHFEAKLYAGTGVANTITGMNFAPDLIWVKVRDDTDNHVLVDTLRGTDSVLFPNSNDKAASSFGRFVSFNSDGFEVATNDTSWNKDTPRNYVAWCWKAGGAPTTGNSEAAGQAQTAGSVKVDGADSSFAQGTIGITSMSVNTTAGFSIVTYTGTGNIGTFPHGLGAAPEWGIFKCIDTDTTDWDCYHVGIGHSRVIKLDQDGGQTAEGVAYFNRTAPTNTLFTLGAGGENNTLNEKMVAYLWTPIQGYSKFGKYGGTDTGGSAPAEDCTYVELGFRPQLLIIKRSNADGDPWIIEDSSRDTSNFAFRSLRSNTTAAEDSSGDQMAIDFLANGFKCRSSNAAISNDSATYIYCAWAENPFGGANTPPVPAR